jgi:protein associated with RNAse G/E
MAGHFLEVTYTKWGGDLHWRMPATRIGADEFGTWLGVARKTEVVRSAGSFVLPRANVVLVPQDGAYTASFYEFVANVDVDVYVDITSIPDWNCMGVTAIDLDVDVVRLANGTIYVDDRDEFEENQRRYGYPAEVVALAESTCAQVLDDLTHRREPYNTVGSDWLRHFLSHHSA